MDTKAKIALFPESPGVYLFRDARGEIIYIGKAKSIKKRVQSYFSRALDAKTQSLVSHTTDIEYRLTPSESSALLLEASLIARYKPKYNISLREQQKFPYVKITREPFPQLCVTRKKENDGARYIGPYTSAGLLREVLLGLRRQFPYRSCKEMPKKACIYYRLGLSPAPCIGMISKNDYRKTLHKIVMVLEGKTAKLIQELHAEMEAKSKNREYETAARIRDQISALSAIGAARVGFDRTVELEDLQHLLGLKNLPLRIEAFDISNIFGQEACGSMVSFFKGRPDKDNYRRFRIKQVNGIDDYAMISEVVARRYSRLLAEKRPLPDLILVDGGKGHFAVVKTQLEELGLDTPLVSIAKEEENIYTSATPSSLKLNIDTPALNLIRRVRDEAHRFAVSYHHVLRRKKVIGK